MTRFLKRDTMPVAYIQEESAMGEFDQVKYKNDFNREKYDRIGVMAPKGSKNEWKNVAASQGKSLNAFIVEAVEEKIETLKP